VAIRYRVNAGKLPDGHWALGPQGGGRLVGEACHMIDLLRHLVGHPVTSRSLQVIAPPPGRRDLPHGDNFALSCAYADGSVAELMYTSLGHAGAGKERIEVHWDGCTAVIDDFKGLVIHGAAGADSARETSDKGHREMLRRFVEHASGRGPAPIPPAEILEVSRLVLRLRDEIRGGANERPED
jgi:predicted dehydrogenase